MQRNSKKTNALNRLQLWLYQLGLPPWAQRLGLWGIPVLLILFLANLAFEAIFEEEISTLWAQSIKPWLDQAHVINITLDGWIIALMLICIPALLFLFLRLITKSIVIPTSNTNTKRNLMLPEDIDKFEFNSTDLIGIVVAARKGETDVDTVANLLIRAVTLKKIKPEAANEILGEFGYELIQLTDGTYRKATKGQ